MAQKLFTLDGKNQQGVELKHFIFSVRDLLPKDGENATTVRMDGGCLV